MRQIIVQNFTKSGMLKKIADLIRFISACSFYCNPKSGKEVIETFEAADMFSMVNPDMFTISSLEEKVDSLSRGLIDEKSRILENELRICKTEIECFGVQKLSSDNLTGFRSKFKERALKAFESGAGKLFIGAKYIIPKSYEKGKRSLEDELEKGINGLINEQMKVKVKCIKDETIEEVKVIVSNEINNLTPSELRGLNRDEFIDRTLGLGSDYFTGKKQSIPGINTSKTLGEFSEICSKDIKNFLKIFTREELDRKYDSVPVWPKNVKELLKEQGLATLKPDAEYTLYTKSRVPYTVTARSDGKVMLPGVWGNRRHCKEQLPCWGGEKKYFDTDEPMDIYFEPDSQSLVLDNSAVYKNKWMLGGHDNAILHFTGGSKPPKPQQELESFEICVAYPWVIKEVRSSERTKTEIGNEKHTLYVYISGEDKGSVQIIYLEHDSEKKN